MARKKKARRTTPAAKRYPRGATTAVMTADPQDGDLGGLYEVYLSPECPTGSVALPVIEKADWTGRLPRRFVNITAKKGAWRVPQLECPECGHRWEAEQPLRPASALRRDDEYDHAETHWTSWDCPKCRAKNGDGNGKPEDTRGTPRGDYVARHRDSAGMVLPLEGQRTERRRYYLNHDEVTRLETLRNPKFVAEPLYTREKQLDTGIENEVRTGWKNGLKPLQWRSHRNARPVNLAQFIECRAVNRVQALSAGELQRYDDIVAQLAGITEDWRIAMADVNEAENEYRRVAEAGDPDALRVAEQQWRDAKDIAQTVDTNRSKLIADIPRT